MSDSNSSPSKWRHHAQLDMCFELLVACKGRIYVLGTREHRDTPHRFGVTQPLPATAMSNVPSSSSRFEYIFDSALDAYKKRTSQDLASHPLLAKFQSCSSVDAILAILREQIPTFGQPQSSHESHSKWLVPVVNVLYALSATLGEGVGLVNAIPFSPADHSDIHFSQLFSPARVVFAGIGVLFLVCSFPDFLAHVALTRVL